MKDPAALLYIDTWLTSTAGMDADVRGWYLNLILHQYDKKDLPNNIEELAVLAGVKFSEYQRFEQVFKQVFEQKFKQNENGRLENENAKEIIRKREQFKDKRSSSGKMSYFIRYITKRFKTTKAVIEFMKRTVDLSDIDLKNEQVLKQVFEQNFELYINGDRDNNTSLWKKDFTVYLNELNIEFERIKIDNNFIEEQERFNPGVDIILSIEKSIKNYWGIEGGWKNKKKSGTVNIDWPATFKNSISSSMNRVFKPKGIGEVVNGRPPRPSMQHSWSELQQKWVVL